MRRIHIALAVKDLDDSIREYTKRLGIKPCCIAAGAYALWRTDSVNLSIRVIPEQAGALRHLGIEDPGSRSFFMDTDVNGIMWERFTKEQQMEEIFQIWPDAQYQK